MSLFASGQGAVRMGAGFRRWVFRLWLAGVLGCGSVAVAAPAASPPSVTPPAAAAGDAAATQFARQDAVRVREALQAWAQAWSRRDMAAYAAAYTPDFQGRAASRQAWLMQRRDRIGTRKQILVKISGLSIWFERGVARVSFDQQYQSDGLSIQSRKTIDLKKVGDLWLIQREVSS